MLQTRFVDTARAALTLVLLTLASMTPGRAAGDTTVSSTEPLTIVTRSGEQRFDVEVMRNDAARGRGLMYRRSMADHHGMLFDFESPQPVNMWMKNTYLSLDMVFIRSDGTIARIASDTEPLSTKIIPSNEPVLAVLELNGGTSAKLGIQPGDAVRHALFKAR